ncbi:fatty acyl-CoA reductase wat isoform X1 [Drosophila subpulchrella]|uniref:fatty acyl-CoA reductase wat isoform X1 n=1 Tax=Drosophila subpulchrella TaxID=1486046 RepID=UPI0018A13125|nr:fatty acyl-CoA reductase wat isoform X1 [Drosophila subpulchrella]
MAKMATEMQRFYKDKVVFLTGGSGFLGKVTIEKLLRTTEVKRIYVLLRSKRGQEMKERCEAWEMDPVFDNLMKVDPEVLNRVVPLGGDCQEPDLGLSTSDRQVLVDEVQIVLHIAATVRFMEPLHIALAVNTRATRLMIQLAKEMPHLEAFVHVSTAYSNCVIENVSERFYPEHLTCPVQRVLDLQESLSPELLDSMAPALMGRYPNTYTYTKALAEQMLQQESGDLPICIFRPGVIIASYKEPMAGWIDNTNGPIAVLYGAAFGVLRITRLNVKAQAGIVPVDYCVNLVLTCAWNTARESVIKLPPEPPIYNLTPTDDNLITWGGFRDKASRLRCNYPLTKMMWMPFLHCTTTPWLFRFLVWFYHLLPGYAIDLVLRLRGRKPRMIKLYDKIHKNIDILAPFVDTTWHFDSSNTLKLWRSMSAGDQKLYDFDLGSIDWDDYFLQALSGIRIYLAKEEPGQETLERAKKILRRFKFLHRLLQFTLCSGAAAILWSILMRIFGLFI